jgi:hypothetical protein
VITDAAAKITDPTDIEAVVQMITSMEVKLQVMCVPLFQSRLCTSN